MHQGQGHFLEGSRSSGMVMSYFVIGISDGFIFQLLLLGIIT